MIAAGTLIVSLTVLRLDNPFVGLSVVWAFAGIMIKRQADYRVILVTAAIAAAVVAAVLVVVFFRKRLGLA